MSMFQGVNGAQNHCGVTSAYNMVAYYRLRLGEPILANDRLTVFTEIHRRMGSGPTLPVYYRSGLQSYISYDTKYKISVSNIIIFGWEFFKAQVDADGMSAMCVWPAVLNAHWINGIGYRIYSNGAKYARIMDNWASYNPLTDPKVPARYTIFGDYLYDLTTVTIYK